MLNDWIRRTGFWTLDRVKGGQIKKNYLDIKKRMENMQVNSEALDELLKYAVSTTPFYENIRSDDIRSFPVITKNLLKEKWNDFHSSAYNGPVHLMSTSGSTGTPFTMEWDMGKRNRQLAELIYFNELAGQKLGQPYIYFRVWTDKNRKSKKEQWMQNLFPIDILHLDDQVLEEIRQRLKSRPYINSCLAYASTYEHIIRYLRSQGDTPEIFHVKSLISGSEVLGMEMKKMIKETMGCLVVDRYSNEENGFLAQTGDVSEDFKVNIASFFIEILKQDSDEDAEIGETGRVVVTDLYSRAVPMIRYDTGDLAVKGSEKDGWTTMLKSIQGRRVDVIYDTSGRKLTAHTWSVYMWKYDKLKQYQFIQEGQKEYLLKLNGAEGIYDDEEIQEYLKTVLGNDAEIKIEHVTGIPVLASGKFKKTVCHYHPELQ